MNKERKLFWVAAILLIAGFFYLSRGEKITNWPSANTTIVAFGDSLTYGIGSSTRGGYVAMLSRDLDVPIKNLGVAGDTTEAAKKRLWQISYERPAITILLIGGNDFLRGVPEEETVRNIGEIIKTVHASGSAVVLVGLQGEILGRRHRRLFEELANEYNTAYVPDIMGGILGNAELMYDNIHPNDQGYRLMAERIRPIVERLLIRTR